MMGKSPVLSLHSTDVQMVLLSDNRVLVLLHDKMALFLKPN
jgi:hypothetical protein